LTLKIKLERKHEEARILSLIYTIISVLLGLLVSGLVLAIHGVDLVQAYGIMAFQVFGTAIGLSEAIVRAIPIALCGIGLTVAFKAKMWNIGAEGQLLMGAIVTTGLALYLNELPRYIMIPLIFIGGFTMGALWGIIPALLRAYFNINEVIVTTMMNYIAMELVRYLIFGPWRGAKEWGYPITDEISDTAKLMAIPGTRIHIETLLICLISALAVYFIMNKTVFGYEVKVVGENPDAAKYAGISFTRIAILSMLISGGLAGIAGTGEVAGIHHRLRYPESISMGYGFTAIIAAWLARLNPIGVLLTSLFFGGLTVSGHLMKMIFRLPVAVVNVFNGVVLLSILIADLMTRYRIEVVLER